jgi:RNA polymerase sigma-70 factor (ECF subfamily)
LPRHREPTGAEAVASTQCLREQSDQDLLEGIRRASEPHFNELYERYFQRIYSFVHGRVRNHADAEEITQETFVSVFRSIDNYRGQASLLSWIFGIAKNLANNAIRRSQSQRQKFDSVEPEHFVPRPSLGACAPDEELHMQRYVQRVREQLETLAEWQRGIFEMRHFENLSIPEIASRTDRSNDAIRSSLYRIKKMMLDAAEQGGGDRAL